MTHCNVPLRGRVVVGVKRGDLEHRPKITRFSEFGGEKHMGTFARSLGLARVTPVVGGYGFGAPHSLGGAIPVIS